jgi:hypothetical protein
MSEVMDGIGDIFSGREGTEKIEQGVDKLIGAAETAIPKAMEVGGKIVDKLGSAILDNGPGLMEMGGGMLLNVAQGIFDTLGGGITGAGKGTKRGHITEIPAAEAANIKSGRNAIQYILSCLKNIAGESQTGGKVIGGAGRDITHRHVCACLDQTGDGLIQRAVTAAAYHNIGSMAPIPGKTGGITLCSGNIRNDLIPRSIVQGNDLGKEAGSPLLSGNRVHNKKHGFHVS